MGSIDAGLGKGVGKKGYEAILKSQVERRTKIGELIRLLRLKNGKTRKQPRSRMQAYDKAIAAEKARDPNSSTLKAMILERAHEEAEMKMWEEKGARRKEGFAQTLATKGKRYATRLIKACGRQEAIYRRPRRGAGIKERAKNSTAARERGAENVGRS